MDKPLRLIWLIIWGLVIGVGYVWFRPQNAPQRQIDPFNAILQGNSFFAISPVEFPHIQVLASQIVDCESGGDNDAVGKYGERGIAQFKQKTFEWMSELAEINGEWLNEEDQWKLLLWALENHLEGHWVCYEKIIN